MKILFTTQVPSDGCLEMTTLFKQLVTLPIIGIDLFKEFTSNNEFTTQWIMILNEMYPNLEIIGNSFFQKDTLKYVLENANNITLEFHNSQEELGTYETGHKYKYLYDFLKKEKCKNFKLVEEPVINTSTIGYTTIVITTILIWKELTKMGELTDAIKRTLDLMKNEPEVEDVPATDDEVKQAMANLGMKIDGYTKQEHPNDQFMNHPVEEPKKPEKKTERKVEKQPEPEVQAPEEVAATEEQPTEIYCKVNNGNMVLMFPAGINLKEITVGGELLKTLTFTVPDVNNSKLQVLPLAIEQPRIVRVPIKLTEEEKIAYGLVKPKRTTKALEVSDDLDELLEQKKVIDSQIKEARKSGDLELVDELRKQRHKIRSKINKIGG